MQESISKKQEATNIKDQHNYKNGHATQKPKEKKEKTR